MLEWLVSLSGEIGSKKPATRRHLAELVWQGWRSRVQAAGAKFGLEEKQGRFLVRAEEDLSPFLASQFGLSRVARLWRLSGLTPEALPWEEILPPRPFAYVVYVDRVAEKAFWSEALALKKALLEKLEAASRQRLTLWDNYPPESLEFRLEIPRAGESWFLWNPTRGPGGLPVGSGERVLVLFSGGPDSLLAAYLLGRRGQEVALLVLDDEEASRFESVAEAARALAYFFPRQELVLWRLPFRGLLEDLSRQVPKRERCFLCKHLMLEIAADLAKKEGFSAVATGEILGEQASQTLPALAFFRGPENFLVLRPVLAWNKEEIFERLRILGLGPVAERRLPPCPFAPGHPHTRPRMKISKAVAILRRVKKLCPSAKKMVLSWGRRSL